MDAEFTKRRSDRIWRFSLRSAVILLAGLAISLLVAVWSAEQVTRRENAEPLLERTLANLTELDALLADAWPALQEAAAEDPSQLVALPHYPLPVGITLSELPDDPQVLRDRIAAESARMVYDQGLSAFAPEGGGLGGSLFSARGAFRLTVGQINDDSREIILVLAAIASALALFLALIVMAMGRGFGRIRNLGWALAVVPTAFAVGTLLVRAFCERTASNASDPFTRELWLLGVEVSEVAMRNAWIAAGLGWALVALGLAIAATTVEAPWLRRLRVS